jgi:16S rRNA (cytosine967-C5)-methyltransferase
MVSTHRPKRRTVNQHSTQKRDGESKSAHAVDVRPALLNLGVRALATVLRFEAPADRVLRRYFRDHPELGRRDRGFIAETTYTALRHLRRLTTAAGDSSPRRIFVAATQLLPVAEQRDLVASLAVEEKVWLSACRLESDADEPLGLRAELPDWIIDIVRETTSDVEVLALGHGMQRSAPLDLRVNTLLCTREEAFHALAASGIAAGATPYSPIGIRVEGKPALERHPLYESGRVEVQDEGSQLACLLVAPRRREMVVDLCAGAGGKTLALGAQMRSEGRLYAFDVSHERIRRLRIRIARSGLSNVQPEVIEIERDFRIKRLAGKIDRVLVDAPCTGLGTLRRNPDLKWRLRPADIAEFSEKQASLLESGARLVKPGGRLVYVTCSFLGAENDGVVTPFLGRHPEFIELDCQALLARQQIDVNCGKRMLLLPHRHGTDGFFAAVFERRGEGGP